jgi:aspartate aminotransferase-like enzyme
MLREKSLLMIPGPTPVPPNVTAAMAAPMINHRGEAFAALFTEVVSGLQYVYRTEQPVYIMPGSGSGGWEFALVNFLQPGDKVLALIIGEFGARWARCAEQLGFTVERMEWEPGEAADPAQVAERLASDLQREIRAVIFQHNDTSVGVMNDVKALAGVVRAHGALVMVDSVSGLGALPLEFDAWGVDVCLTGAQKALMCPPGLTIVAVSERARAAGEAGGAPRFYFDWKAIHKAYTAKTATFTPALSLWYGLAEALKMIRQETVEGAWERHALMGRMCRAGIRALGLGLLAKDERVASNSVTAVHAPFEPKLLRRTAREQLGVQLAGGQAQLERTIFRIGHLGYVTPQDVLTALGAVGMTTALHGAPGEAGAGVLAAQQVWMDHLRAEGGRA